MKETESEKFKEWFKNKDISTLSEVYNLLQDEFTRRGKSIETDRTFYSTSRDSSDQIVKSMVNHFDSVFEKHHGF